jgi:hypothetical protein
LEWVEREWEAVLNEARPRVGSGVDRESRVVRQMKRV